MLLFKLLNRILNNYIKQSAFLPDACFLSFREAYLDVSVVGTPFHRSMLVYLDVLIADNLEYYSIIFAGFYVETEPSVRFCQ